MKSITAINDSIFRLTLPFADIYTTIFLVKTCKGALIFDTATYDYDADKYIIPFLDEIGIDKDFIKYIFISHNHGDHSGGLKGLLTHLPKATVITKSEELKNALTGYSAVIPEDGETVLDELRVVTIPGHTEDSCGILDTRTNILISGDSLQLHGIIGSGEWAANIRLPLEHYKAVDKLRAMDIEAIYTAHDYVPCGSVYSGKDMVSRALDACIEPLEKIKKLILQSPDLTDEEIRDIYNSESKPRLGAHVVTAVRKDLI